MIAAPRSRIEPDDRAVAIYHVVYEYEDFVDAAQALFQLVGDAERLQPGKKRKLFLDIDGHRNGSGGFDADMLELQKDFLLEFLGQYLAEIHAPLINVRNEKPQLNDLPPELIVKEG
jgi:hypothetical protein